MRKEFLYGLYGADCWELLVQWELWLWRGNEVGDLRDGFFADGKGAVGTVALAGEMVGERLGKGE